MRDEPGAQRATSAQLSLEVMLGTEKDGSCTAHSELSGARWRLKPRSPGPLASARVPTSSRQTQAAGEFWRLLYSNGPAEDCVILASCSLATASKKMLPEKEGAS